MYVAKVLESSNDLCLGDKKKHWYLPPDDSSVSLNRASSLVIVIESNVKPEAKGRCGTAKKPLDLDQALLSNYIDSTAKPKS
ncbi:MAG: hypothetical protein R3F36_03120 [Candidatus Competibacteraceae bacterium]